MPGTKRAASTAMTSSKPTKRFIITKSQVPQSKTIRFRNMVNLGQGFPKMVLQTMRYSELVTLNVTTGTPSTYRYSCNGLFDPNTTGGGGQPEFFDQMTPIYNHYCVIGAKATFRWTPIDNTSAGAIPVTATFFINDDTSQSSNDPTVQAMYQSAKTTMHGAVYDKPITMTQKWSAKKYFGKSPLANTELQGTSGSNPTEQSFFNFTINSIDGASSVSGKLYVFIEYITVWKEPKDVAAS